LLHGRKLVGPGDRCRLWTATTTLRTTITGPAGDPSPHWPGVLKLSAADFLRQLTTARGPICALARYVVFFLSRVAAAASGFRRPAPPHREEFP
jgi:hypothetical protein